MYTDRNLTAWLDLSTYCNAACPQCHRTDVDGCGKVEWLPLVQWSFAQFKDMFPPETLGAYRNFDICGTWGDPGMNKDLVKICSYILNSSMPQELRSNERFANHNHTSITLHTNGSMRDEDFWWKLGHECGKRLKIEFTLDGTTQEMHSLYRRKTDLIKTLEHMEAAAEGGATVTTFTVVFKHNQDYIHEIRELAEEFGSTDSLFVPSNRFHHDTSFGFMSETGESLVLEETTLDIHDPIFYDKIPVRNTRWREKVSQQSTASGQQKISS